MVLELFKAKVRRIGNSLGVIMPKEVLDETNVREGDEIIVKGVEKVKVEEMFGIWKGLPPFKHVSEDHEF
ncbi:MAG: AbrB/MazE/SpoVT family DNA-binding domain-containing protein [Methanocellales archaeon]|nr:AbrB/MazE/SpoVT family DNA-binding domain-containing protein [Methanocellales archaeon]